jgi:hypothetical protein
MDPEASFREQEPTVFSPSTDSSATPIQDGGQGVELENLGEFSPAGSNPGVESEDLGVFGPCVDALAVFGYFAVREVFELVYGRIPKFGAAYEKAKGRY